MIEPGRTAIIHYVGRIAEGDSEGEVFDTTDVDVALEEDVYHGHRDYKPLEFTVGADEVIAGIEDAVREMDVGETRTVTVTPASGYGERDDDLVLEIPRRHLEADSGREAKPWKLVGSENGEVGWIIDVGEETVTVDFNHDLAGHALEFEITLLDVRDRVPEPTERGSA